MSYIENTVEVFQDNSLAHVCPNVTRWTSHDRTCISLEKDLEKY